MRNNDIDALRDSDKKPIPRTYDNGYKDGVENTLSELWDFLQDKAKETNKKTGFVALSEMGRLSFITEVMAKLTEIQNRL